MKKVYSGVLSIDEYGCLNCGGSLLIEDMNSDFKTGDTVFLRYFIADKEMTEAEAEEALIMKTLGANIDKLDFVLDAYSEYTILDYNEEAVIGGHDLFNELADSEGKYLLLVIEGA